MADTIDLVVTLDSLKSIEFAEIGEINVIIGPNNSGKTTVLRALTSSTYATQIDVEGRLASLTDKFRIVFPSQTVEFRPLVNMLQNKVAEGQWRMDPTILEKVWGAAHTDISIVESRLRKSSLRFSRKLFCLWHRRKSDYRAPLERVDELDSEATKMVARLAQIRHGSEQGARINKFVADVIPGCPGFTVRPVDNQNSQIFVGEHPLQSVGGGVEQTLAIALALITEDPKCTLIIEEPETNLHPSSQRILVRKIMDLRGDRMIFITTHSPVILNEIASKDSVNVYRIRPNMAEGTRITPSRTTSDIRDALDGIGARPSDILQANCVIWVEGPTEAIVLRHLIELYHPSRYVEHTDMEFMFTGGATITHMGSEDGRLIDLLRICRNAFVLFDRDAPIGAAMNRKGRPALSKLPHVSEHITWGYEFEWYYPESIVAELFKKVDGKLLFGADKGSKPFYKVLHEAGGSASPSKTKVAQQVVTKMTAIDPQDAKRLWSEGAAGADLKKLLDKIVGWLERGRADPSSAPPNS